MNKPDKYIILKITNEGIFYNDNSFIEWRNTNFPPKNEFGFNEMHDIFWEAKLLAFEHKTSQLKVAITSYDAHHKKELLTTQSAKFPFQKIWFDKLKWTELEKLMNSRRTILFSEISDMDEQFVESKTKDKVWVDDDDSKIIIENTRIDINFKYPLMKSNFKMGFVEIEKNIKGIQGKTKINVINVNVIPEFDYVKPFFAKALGKGEIEVTGYLEIDITGEIEVKCQSNEVNQINEDLITIVRSLQLEESIFKPREIIADKSLFTPEEYFEDAEKRLLGHTADKETEDLVEEILRLKGIRNQRQLIYLSGKLQSKKTGLRFTLSPKFGFLFYVEGRVMDHFIWELLNSHATYIWSIDKEAASLENKLNLIEIEINIIRKGGRKTYLNSKKNTAFTFNKINHESSSPEAHDGFIKWKMRVDEKIL